MTLVCQTCIICEYNSRVVNEHKLPVSSDWACSTCSPRTALYNSALLNSVVKHSDKLSKAKGLKIAHQNIRSFKNKFEGCKLLMLQCDIDFISFTETMLDPLQHKDESLLIDGYNMRRFDRDFNKGGGTLVYFKSQFQIEQIALPFTLPHWSECLVFKVKYSKCKPLICCSVYLHPSVPNKKKVEFFEQLNQFLCQFELETYIFGDFNLNLLKYDNDVFDLYRVCKTFGLWQFISNATFDRGSLLDHFYSTHSTNVTDFGNFPAGSDHDLIFVIRQVIKPKFSPTILSCRSYKGVKWKEFSEELSSFTPSSENVEELFTEYNNHFMELVNKHCPLKKRLVKARSANWYKAYLVPIRKLRDKAQLLYRLNGDKTLFHKARNLYNSECSKAKRVYFNTKFVDHCAESSKLWNTVNELTGFRKKSSEPISKLEDPLKNVTVTEPEFVEELLINQFIVKSEPKIELPQLDRMIEEYSTSTVESSSPDKVATNEVTEEEIVNAISSVKKGNANNSFPPFKLFKGLKSVVALQIAFLFSICLKTSCVPTAFKNTIITPVYKGKGSKFLACNFRPISGLNVYCKIFEAFLYHRLRSQIDAKLSDAQHGFRPKRSCMTAISEFTKYIYSSLDKRNGIVVALYIDAKVCFDSVDRSLLLSKLMSEFSLSPTYIKLLRSYLFDRSIQLKSSSNLHSTRVGLVQGGTICPLLMTAFQNDLSKIIDLPFLMYADDVVVYLGGTDLDSIMARLKDQCAKISKWYDDNNMFLNYSKTKFQIFNKAQDRRTLLANLEIDGHEIERVSEFRYLGVIFDSNLSFLAHYKSVLCKVSGRLKYLYGLKRLLSEQVMKILVNCYVITVIDYGLEFWGICDSKLATLQKKLDSFLLCYFLPTLWRKSNRKKQTPVFNNLELLDKCNFLPISEKRDYLLLRYCFKSCNLDFDNFTEEDSWPRLAVERFNTTFAQGSAMYRAVKLWNSFPRAWSAHQLSLASFLTNVIEYFKCKRN